MRVRHYGRAALIAALVSALGLAAFGCEMAHQRAVRRAQRAEYRGNLYDAARSYDRACQKKPSDRRSCRRAERLAREAVARDVTKARTECRLGAFDLCWHTVASARHLYPDDPVLVAFIDEVARLEAAQCLEIQPRDPTWAVARLRCLDGYRAASRSDRADKLFAREARELGERFETWAMELDATPLPGASYALWALATCAAPEPARATWRDRSREQYIEANSVPVELSLRINERQMPDLAKHVCQHLAWESRGALRCIDSDSPIPPLRIEAVAKHKKPRHQRRQEQRSLRYRSETQQLDNPQHQRARDDLRLAETALRDIEQQSREREEQCRLAQQDLDHAGGCVGCPERRNADQSCAAYFAVRPIYERRLEAVDSAQRRLNQTPAQTATPRFTEFRYRVTQHSWSAPYTIEMRVPGEKRPASVDSGALTFSDIEHPGSAEADLEADPRTEPPQGFFGDELHRRLIAGVGAHVRSELERRAAEQRALCNRNTSGGVEQIECRAISALWDQRPIVYRGAPIPSHVGLESGVSYGRPLGCGTPEQEQPGERSWLGVMVSSVTPAQAVDSGLERPRGAVVNSVFPAGPAQAAGVAGQDIITRFDGVLVEEPRDLGRLTRRARPESTVILEVLRGGSRLELHLRLGHHPGDPDA